MAHALVELDRGGISYTIDTLTRLHDEQPHRELFFLMGADSVADLPAWREPERICQLVVADLPQEFAPLITLERRCAITRPMPEPPPVTITTLPKNRIWVRCSNPRSSY